MRAAKVIPGYLQRTRDAAITVELGMHFLKMGRNVRKRKWQYRLQKIGRMRPPKIARKAEWISIHKGRRAAKWTTVIEKVWKN